MPTFDFISGKPFRESLEADYSELEICFGNGAWKSVQVLAGSIVESVLIDYLLATKGNRQSKDPLKMDLAEAITLCRTEGAITQRTADLCSVVRSYRNLIHPGRVIRLAEEQPTQSSAGIARSLIDLIVTDISKVRRDTFGLTAEQLLSKVERDENCLPILHKLLEEMSASERDRFYTDILPDRYIAIAESGSGFGGAFNQSELTHLQRAHEIAREVASPEALKKAVSQYLRVLRQGDGSVVGLYDDALFQIADLNHLPAEQRALVKQHHLGKLKTPTMQRLRRLVGIERYLDPSEAPQWTDAFVRVITSGRLSDDAKQEAQTQFSEAQARTSREFDDAIETRLDQWAAMFRSKSKTQEESQIVAMKADMVRYQFDDFPSALDDEQAK
jgi:hypothetical protein